MPLLKAAPSLVSPRPHAHSSLLPTAAIPALPAALTPARDVFAPCPCFLPSCPQSTIFPPFMASQLLADPLAFSWCLALIVAVHPHHEVVLLINNFQNHQHSFPFFVISFQPPLPP